MTAKTKNGESSKALNDASGNRGGRPAALQADDKTLALIESLGKIQCTQQEAAAVLKVSRDTFIEFMKREPAAREAWDRGLDEGRASLRRVQFKSALGGNATMMIWLGKQYLGQHDKTEHMGANGGPISFTGSPSELRKNIESKLAGLAARKGKK